MKSAHTDEYRAILEIVVSARADAGVTQQRLADRLGKPQSFVSKYESGERRLDVAEFLQILLVLKHDPHRALGEILASSPFKRLRLRTRT